MKQAAKKSKANRRPARTRKSREPIRIAVLEADPLRLVGFRALFGPAGEFSIRASTVPGILKALSDDVVLMTVSRGTAFYSAMASLKAVRPGVRIIVTGSSRSDEDILRALAAGAKGYVPEDATPEHYRSAIRLVHQGQVWAPRRVLATFIERVTATTAVRQIKPNNGQMISQRQRQVLGLLAVGSSNREIAGQLGLTERTVKAHVAGLLRKIGAPNRIALSVHPVTHTLLAIGR